MDLLSALQGCSCWLCFNGDSTQISGEVGAAGGYVSRMCLFVSLYYFLWAEYENDGDPPSTLAHLTRPRLQRIYTLLQDLELMRCCPKHLCTNYNAVYNSGGGKSR